MANLFFPHFLNLHRTLACAKSKELSVQIYMDFAAAARAWGKCCDLGACIAADNIMTTIIAIIIYCILYRNLTASMCFLQLVLGTGAFAKNWWN